MHIVLRAYRTTDRYCIPFIGYSVVSLSFYQAELCLCQITAIIPGRTARTRRESITFFPDVIDKSLYNAESVIGTSTSESKVAALIIGGEKLDIYRAMLAGNLKPEGKRREKSPKYLHSPMPEPRV
ncbi:hypothetical protein E4U50_000566 [Claviceps purpurea]|nr:hypothetical protein E4U50_000566 [Claviceps purpurea]